MCIAIGHVRFTPDSDAHWNVRLKARRSTECSARPHPALQDQGRLQYLEAIMASSCASAAQLHSALLPSTVCGLRRSSTGLQQAAAGKAECRRDDAALNQAA